MCKRLRFGKRRYREEVDGWKWYDIPHQEYLIWKFNNENAVLNDKTVTNEETN